MGTIALFSTNRDSTLNRVHELADVAIGHAFLRKRVGPNVLRRFLAGRRLLKALLNLSTVVGGGLPGGLDAEQSRDLEMKLMLLCTVLFDLSQRVQLEKVAAFPFFDSYVRDLRRYRNSLRESNTFLFWSTKHAR
jgi:hypothetical protein